MNMNDPFGFAKIQRAVQQTQKIVESVNTVSNKLSEDYGDSKHKPLLDSLADKTQAAAGKLEQLEGNIVKAGEKVAETASSVEAKKDEITNLKPLSADNA
jgi:predicted  nucleic acid-binding Zn-ribbon protein